MVSKKTAIHEQIICAGFGGQGIMILGKLIAQAAMIDGFHTTWMPSYGAEVRGGTAHSMVRVSCEDIASPLVKNPDTCIAMNRPSFEKFVNRVKKKGIIIVNTSLTGKLPKKEGIRIIGLPLTELASGTGNIKVANIIALGAYVKLKNFLSRESVMKSLKDTFKEKQELLAINEKALIKGETLV